MKHYCKCSINQLTGEIDHVVVSTSPLLPGQETKATNSDGSQVDYKVDDIEFESVNGDFIDAEQVRKKVKVSGKSVADKVKKTAKAVLDTSKEVSNFTGFKNV